MNIELAVLSPPSHELNAGTLMQRIRSTLLNISILIHRTYNVCKTTCSKKELSKMACLAIALFTIVVTIISVLVVCLAIGKPEVKCQSTFRQIMKSSISQDSHPRCVVVDDINNDHQLDIIIVESGADSVGILLSNGSGTFAGQQKYSTGLYSSPYAAVVGYFDDDNNLDIATANYGTNSIGILFGLGNGTFDDVNILSLDPSRPGFITKGDMNNDNRMDLVVVHFGTDSIRILFQQNDGLFENMIIYSTGYDSLPYSLAIGDFNNDNNLDIAVANYGTDNVGIFLGYGNGRFASQVTYTTSSSSNPLSIVLGDFNNDNHLDIALANSGIGSIGILHGNGNGTFQTQILYSISSNSYLSHINVGNFNKDNRLDIVVTDSKNDRIHVLLGNETFPILTTYDAIVGTKPFWVAVTDFPNDNQSDIVVANYGDNDVRTLIGYSMNRSVRIKTSFDGNATITGIVAVGDFNSDHIPDIVFNVIGGIVVGIGLGDGTFGKKIPCFIGNQSNLQYIAVADLNNDSRMDIVISDIGYNFIGVFLNNGNETFAAIKTYSTDADSRPYHVVITDINNDNRLDIISANSGTNSIGIFVGKGDGTFATMIKSSLPAGYIPYSVGVGDINHDNRPDIVVAIWSGYVFVLLGLGNVTFTLSRAYILGTQYGTFSIILANFNGDNHLDIAVSNAYGHSVCVLLGYGDGTFAKPISYTSRLTSQLFYIVVVDLNNDGINDILASDYDNDEIVVFSGYGNGNFTLTAQYSTANDTSPYGFTVADLDNDKKLEIIVALSAKGYIALLTEYYQAKFVYQTIYPTGSAQHPSSVTAGDLNNDNYTDIVVANSATDNLSIQFGFGNGTFGTELMYFLGSDYDPQYVIASDIDKDNQLDIISVSSKKNSISVIMGYGNGTFRNNVTLGNKAGLNPYSVAVGDLNNDTRIDFVVANEGSDTIGVFYGFNYTKFFITNGYMKSGSRAPLGIIVNDFNNDNYLDIATTYYSTNEIGILLGYGNGRFADIITYPTGNGSFPWGITAGDFNNDSFSDIVVTNVGTNSIGIFLNNGNGSFATNITYSTGQNSEPRSVAVGDLNNDGKLDIVEANFGADNIGVLLGYGNGTFSILKLYSTGQDSYPCSLILDDFNNDSQLDIAVANNRNNTVGILLGYGNGTFGQQNTYSTGFPSGPYWVTAGDFDNDHQLDIATANLYSSNVGILLGYGNGSFATVVSYDTGSGSLPRCVKVGDFNNDKILDIAVVNSQGDYVIILFGIGDGKFLLGAPYPTDDYSNPYGLAIGDFNNDTKLDIATALTGINYILVHLGDTSQLYAGTTPYYTGAGSKPHSVTVSDLDKDGWLEVITANYGTDNIYIFRRCVSNTLCSTSYSTGNGSAPTSVATYDFNNDHHLDIIVTNSATDNIAILFGYGDGNFSAAVTHSTGDRSKPLAVAIADFDNDNITDIAVANSGTSNILILHGSVNGTIGGTTSYPLGYGYNPYSLVATDLNHDDWMDVVVACYGTDHVVILLKICEYKSFLPNV